WSALAAGFLTGKFKKGEQPPAGTRLDKYKERMASFANERNWKIIETATGIAKEVNASIPQVALAWVAKRPSVTSVIFGARNVPQLEDNVKAGEVMLSPAQMKRLEDASAFDIGYPYDFMGRIANRW